MRAFYERFHGYALTVCMAYSKNRDDALEVMNDGFLKVFKNLKNLDNPAVLLPWLRRIMVNTAIDYYRKNSRNKTETLTELQTEQVAEPYQNDVSVYAQLSANEIMQVVQALPMPYRMVFSLFVVEGYAHKQIAEQLHIAESTSRSHLTDANKMLRKKLTEMTKIEDEQARR
jgi:RNA polymerase sigma-70 factor (ECF subfamily)